MIRRDPVTPTTHRCKHNSPRLFAGEVPSTTRLLLLRFVLVSCTDEPLGQSRDRSRSLNCGTCPAVAQAREIHATSTPLMRDQAPKTLFRAQPGYCVPGAGQPIRTEFVKQKRAQGSHSGLPPRATTQEPCCALEVAISPRLFRR